MANKYSAKESVLMQDFPEREVVHLVLLSVLGNGKGSSRELSTTYCALGYRMTSLNCTLV